MTSGLLQHRTVAEQTEGPMDRMDVGPLIVFLSVRCAHNKCTSPATIPDPMSYRESILLRHKTRTTSTSKKLKHYY